MALASALPPLILDGVLVLSPAQGWLMVCEQLAVAYLDGVRRVIVVDENGRQTAERALKRFNALLASRGLKRVALRVIAPDGRAGQKIQQARAEQEQVEQRRNVLRSQHDETPSQGLAQLQRIKADMQGALFAAAPVISPGACTGCNACLRVCPHDVLSQINDTDTNAHYHAQPTTCDACGLCVEVCSPGAIEVQTMVTAPADIPLQMWNCPDCGVATRAPTVQGRSGAPCPICQASGHHKKLFQVLQ